MLLLLFFFKRRRVCRCARAQWSATFGFADETKRKKKKKELNKILYIHAFILHRRVKKSRYQTEAGRGDNVARNSTIIIDPAGRGREIGGRAGRESRTAAAAARTWVYDVVILPLSSLHCRPKSNRHDDRRFFSVAIAAQSRSTRRSR